MSPHTKTTQNLINENYKSLQLQHKWKSKNSIQFQLTRIASLEPYNNKKKTTTKGTEARCNRIRNRTPFLPIFGFAAIAVQMEKSIEMRIIADTWLLQVNAIKKKNKKITLKMIFVAKKSIIFNQ